MSALIYGAYGYTGQLIAQAAVERGLQPVLAGRNADRLAELGAALDLPTRTVSLSDPERLRTALDGISVALHCAGPFVRTAPPMIAACLETGTHYLDLTGEVDVFRRLADRGADAEAAGCMVLPGIGFDVVPSDCLSRFVAAHTPDADILEVALYAEGTVSQGTLKTLIEQMGRGGVVRREGRLHDVPPGWTSRNVDFGDRRRGVTSIPEGSVVTSGVSTDVPNVTAYIAVPLLVQSLLRASRHVQGILTWPPLKQLLKRLVEQGRPGPSAEERQQGRTVVWASARGSEGGVTTARLHGPEAYTFTARSAVEALQRVLDGTAPAGYQTPATAFGADFALAVDGTSRQIVDEPSRA
ncbi:saccharopine dehydrogenase (NAD+, L-lysine-forming) [Salinibacter ruber]|uniref:saccharopine dehydrogenase family protein n=1 Tax=Salinibacter ruber TaxID=146919 RepID=UPI0021682320|nr:saccharopine dehydrogenase NADP-binding domain-containing protein [Salinibacter ruber]MCS3666719.1 saccharopine dehydrogenase (NAD+, L-lysine-forming) [Salinibacter ruber]MCS4193333.1 saccharopine dehydrogenase (NAD+, L-lysine-forming) [Salinibacter ruber]